MAKQAIEGTRLNAFGRDPETLTLVGEDPGFDTRSHPLYDPRVHLPVAENLVRAMMADGFRSTISVAVEGDAVLVVAGRRRVKAAREANKRLAAAGREPIKVKCLVEKGEASKLFGLLVSENELREGNTPMQRANLVSRYLDFTGNDEAGAAIRFGVSEQTIRNYLVLCDLHPAIQAAVDAGKLSASAAAKLADLPKAEQPGVLDELVSASEATGEKVTADKAERASDPNKVRLISKKILKRVLKNKPEYLTDEHMQILALVLGEYDAGDEVDGLREILEADYGKPAKKNKVEVDEQEIAAE